MQETGAKCRKASFDNDTNNVITFNKKMDFRIPVSSYSDLKLFTGFAHAVLMVCTTTSKPASSPRIRTDTRNGSGVREILYAYC